MELVGQQLGEARLVVEGASVEAGQEGASAARCCTMRVGPARMKPSVRFPAARSVAPAARNCISPASRLLRFLNVQSLVRRRRCPRIVVPQAAWAMLCALLIFQVP
ncbi:hypothetical protein [Streptomyces decoyicus]|uniref:hypothetical protein n=1 Tax=Streptomyces decoyicus TaxID=249567 RepID=UPI0038705CCD